MKPADLTPPGDVTEEVAALIETLLETGHRLEELTAGEVDAVADRDGRMFLLRHAQDQLRVVEATKQAAILNALPANVALLDTQGLIVSVNEAWRRFGRANAAHAPGHGVGVNYLAVCDRARGHDAFEARQAAAGIRSVLAGEAKDFSLEYPCHSPTQQRWFLMTVTPLVDDRPNGAVVMHLNITERKQTAAAHQRLVAILESTTDLVSISDPAGHLLYLNRAARNVLGVEPHEEIAQTSIADFIPDPVNHPVLIDGIPTAIREGAWSGETVLLGRHGQEIHVSQVILAHKAASGKLEYLSTIMRDITKRMLIEETLLRQQTELRVLFDLMPAMIWFKNTENGILRVNKRVAEAAGKSVEEIEGKPSLDIYPLEASRFYVDDLEVIHSGTPKLGIIETIPGPDGRELWIQTDKVPYHNKDGEVIGIVVMAQDITERKRSEEALRASMEEFRTLAEAMPQIVWITRADGRAIYINQQWADYTGITLEESLGHGLNKLFHPDDQQRAWDAWQHAMATVSPYSIESRLRRADGIYRWWLVRGVPLQDAAGNILKWFGTCTDIHDLKLAELEITRANLDLRESERRFSNMLGNVELASLMLDREARITYCNEYLLRLTGWQHDEVIGRNWLELFIPSEASDTKDNLAVLLKNQPEAWHHENEILTRSGERRLIRWNNSVLRSGAGDVVGTASIGTDITEQKRAEISIKHLNRVFAMLSGINSLIVRARDREELFREACRIAVEKGGFRMSLVCIVDRVTLKIVPVASAGKHEELMNAIKTILSSSADAQNTMVARAIREGKAVVSNDSQNDPRVLFSKHYTETGVHSMAVFPLIIADKTIGVVALYAAESEFFHEEELKLLTDLTGDIAFGIDHIDKQERLDYLAYYDALTGLPNRTLFHQRLEQGTINAKKHDHKLALVLLDLDRFKAINDSIGRPAGDALLKAVAARMAEYAGDVTRLARIDADHFAVMVLDVQNGEELARLIEQRVTEVFSPPYLIGDSELRLAVKFGIAMFPTDGADAETLFQNAEVALKNAKRSGERYQFYSHAMNEHTADKLLLENQLRQAIEKSEFVLHYQPKINLVSGKVTSAEALIRWNDPRTGLVPPGRFIPILEETGLIYEVGRWALRQAIADYLRWRNAGLPAVRIAVNVSPLQLRDRGFIDEISQVIAIDAQAAAGLELEITESLIMDDTKLSIASLQAIRAMGVTIAIDDFGTGFSSLSYLAKLPVDTLKIDRSFVIDMTAGPEGLALVSTIINLAHSLKLKVVAEGVETEEQSRLLRLLDCDEMQGFLFCKPVPSDIFETRFLTTFPAG